MKIKQIDLNNSSYNIIDNIVREQITNKYNSNNYYSVGDFCIHNNQLYQCIKDTNGSWDNSKWKQKKVVDLKLEKKYYIKNLIDDTIFNSILEKNITNIEKNNIKQIKDYAFQSCTSLQSAGFSQCTTIGSYAFQECSLLQSISFPQCTTIGNGAFESCTSLQLANFPQCTTIGMSAFYNCTSLQSVYLLAPSVCTLVNSNAFTSTPIQNSSYLGYFGSIYVPSSLVNAYKSATNWTYYSDRITAYIP